MPEKVTSLVDLLWREEGFRPTPYQDSKGLWTVGAGWCLERRPMSMRIARLVLEEQAQENLVECITRWPWMKGISEPRRTVLVSMAFQMGAGGLAGFHNLLAAAEKGDWETAAREGLDSKWAKEDTPDRAHREMEILRTGEW